MSKIDRDEAPEGYRAYKFVGKSDDRCGDCEYPASIESCLGVACRSYERNDGISAIFKKKKDKDVSK